MYILIDAILFHNIFHTYVSIIAYHYFVACNSLHEVFNYIDNGAPEEVGKLLVVAQRNISISAHLWGQRELFFLESNLNNASKITVKIPHSQACAKCHQGPLSWILLRWNKKHMHVLKVMPKFRRIVFDQY